MRLFSPVGTIIISKSSPTRSAKPNSIHHKQQPYIVNMKHPLLLLLTATCHAAPSSGPATAASVTSRKPLRFTSPLQSFTIFDGEPAAPPRAKYLPRLRAGLLAEKRARERIAAEELRRGLLPSQYGDVSDKGGGWAEHSAAEEERRKKVADATAEKAYDEAVAAFDARWIRSDGGAGGRCAGGGHQFVGVIDAESQGVTWYARPNVTPIDRWYGFGHLQDELVVWPRLSVIWSAMGLGAFGPPASVDGSAPPYGNSRQLTTNLPHAAPAWYPAPFHSATVVDLATPTLPGGAAVYLPVWIHICFP